MLQTLTRIDQHDKSEAEKSQNAAKYLEFRAIKRNKKQGKIS